MSELEEALMHAIHRTHPFSESCSGCLVAVDLLRNLETAPACPQVDPELYPWLRNAIDGGGRFVANLAQAAFRADEDNYRLLRPFLLIMKHKYPKYSEGANAKTGS
jgi:hypothetical protein